MPKSTRKPATKSDGRRPSKKPPKQTKIMDAIAELKKADDIANAALEKDPDAEDTIGWMQGAAISLVRRKVLAPPPTSAPEAVVQFAAAYGVVRQILRAEDIDRYQSDETEYYVLAVLRRLLRFFAAETKIDLEETMLTHLSGHDLDIDDDDEVKLAKETLKTPAVFKHAQ
jgi:hypothetical protein